MGLVFSQQFKEGGLCHIDEKTARDIMLKPDHKKDVVSENGAVFFYLKKIDEKYHVLIVAAADSHDIRADLAIKIPVGFIAEIGTQDPLAIVEKLVEKFGLEMKINNNPKGRLIYGETFPIPRLTKMQDLAKYFQFVNPENKAFDAIGAVVPKRDFQNDWSMEVIMAFCIDRLMYKSWIQKESV